MSDATYNNKIHEAEADESNSEAFVVSDEFINQEMSKGHMECLVKQYEQLRVKARFHTEPSPPKLDGQTLTLAQMNSKMTGKDAERLRKLFIKDAEMMLESMGNFHDGVSCGPSTLENKDEHNIDFSQIEQKKPKAMRKVAPHIQAGDNSHMNLQWPENFTTAGDQEFRFKLRKHNAQFPLRTKPTQRNNNDLVIQDDA